MVTGEKRDTNRIGERSELEVATALVRAGFSVSLPYGSNRRYDIIADKNGNLLRIQVKTGRVRNGVLLFNCYSTHSHRNGPSCRPYSGEVEYFAVYCESLNAVFLVPAQDVATRGALRIENTKNKQVKRIRWASPYLLGTDK